MKRSLAIILCLCFMNNFSYALQTPNAVGIETRKEKFQELKDKKNLDIKHAELGIETPTPK